MAQPLALIKFCDIETGLKILNSQTLRWSAPACYHDPFEPHHDTPIAFSREELIQGLIKQASALLFGPSLPGGDANRLIAAIRRWRDEDRFTSEEEAESVLRQLLTPLAEQHYSKIAQFHHQWQDYARRVRICSFAEKADNLLCWQRYADNHAGIALKFRCGDDTALPNPQGVNYREQPPAVIRLSDQVAILFGQQQPPDQRDFQQLLLSKSRLNRGEQEWRCFSSEDSDDDLHYMTRPFPAAELKAVYFGLSVDSNERAMVSRLLREKYPQCRQFSARIIDQRYALEFQPGG